MLYKLFSDNVKVQNDFATVTFDTDVYDGKVFKVQFTPLVEGVRLTAFGYGKDKDGKYSRMQRLDFAPLKTVILFPGELFVYSRSRINDGDSGGPLIDLTAGTIVGISSSYSPAPDNSPGAVRFFSMHREYQMDKLLDLIFNY